MPNPRPTLDLGLVWKAGHEPRKSIDPELFALLEAIKNTGKLTEATDQVGMRYRQAWGLITAWSERLGKPLVSKEQGRGTKLTELGEKLLWLRERINARLAPYLESAASEVEQELSKILREPGRSLTMFASHDLVLAELREFLRTRPGPKLDVRFVGSLESVVALCKNRCELAGFHLPEGALGREVLRKYEPWLKPRAQRLIHFVRRNQGLLVAPGNPLGVRTLKDIAGRKARFINRQRGSGRGASLADVHRPDRFDPPPRGRGDRARSHAGAGWHISASGRVGPGRVVRAIGRPARDRRCRRRPWLDPRRADGDVARRGGRDLT